MGDFLGGEVPQWFGEQFRKLQSGVVQNYMAIAMLIAIGSLFYYIFILAQ